MAYFANRSVQKTLDPISNPLIVMDFDALGSFIAERSRAPGANVPLVDHISDHAGLVSEFEYLALLGEAGVDNVCMGTVKAVVVTGEERGRKVAIWWVAPAVRPQRQNVVTGDSPRARLSHHAGASDAVIAATLVDRLGKTSG